MTDAATPDAGSTALHAQLARDLNAEVWRLLDRSDRSREDDAAMVNAAHASLHHWTIAGGPVEHARGEWLVSHVYAVLGRSEPAVFHAGRCMEICERHGIGGFDLGYAHEAWARAAAAAGDLDRARRHHAIALAAADAMTDDEERTIYLGDLATGPWYGLGDPEDQPA